MDGGNDLGVFPQSPPDDGGSDSEGSLGSAESIPRLDDFDRDKFGGVGARGINGGHMKLKQEHM